MNVIEAREQWLASPGRHHWQPDDGELDEALRDAFAAGWNAARPAICGTGSGGASHNSDGRPGHLEVTVWGRTEDGQPIALVFGEEAARRLQASLTRFGF